MNSTSPDIVNAYACYGGKLLPGKHISLGVVLKSITGSKWVVNLLNRFGHCIINEKVHRIDTGMESSLTSSNSLVPNRITKTPELYTALAWDNFDVNLETLSGADSVHHTYGICYQNISSTIQVPQKITETTCKNRKIKDITSVLKEAREMELPPCRTKTRNVLS